MSNVVRCDNCGSYSDKLGDYVGDRWQLSVSGHALRIKSSYKDYCKNCLIKILNDFKSELEQDKYTNDF